MSKIEDGTVIWTRVDQLRGDRQRGESDEILSSFLSLQPSDVTLEGSDRGLVSWAIKSLKFFDYDIAKRTALSIAHGIESRLAGPEGIYHIDSNGDLIEGRRWGRACRR